MGKKGKRRGGGLRLQAACTGTRTAVGLKKKKKKKKRARGRRGDKKKKKNIQSKLEENKKAELSD